jgi:hypothetical protein
MIAVMGSLIADISLRLPKFPVTAGSMHRLSYLASRDRTHYRHA